MEGKGTPRVTHSFSPFHMPPRYKAGAPQDIPAPPQQLDLPSALFTLHPGWDIFNMQRAVLRRKRNGMNWTDCEPAKRCSTLSPYALGVLSGIRLAAAPARETEERRGGTWTRLPAAAFRGLLGAPAYFPEGGVWSHGAWSCSGFHWHLLLGGAWLRVPWQQLGPNQRGERRPVRAGLHPPAGKPPGAALGRSVPAGEAQASRSREEEALSAHASNDCMWALF